jgi:hypothetical protein
MQKNKETITTILAPNSTLQERIDIYLLQYTNDKPIPITLSVITLQYNNAFLHKVEIIFNNHGRLMITNTIAKEYGLKRESFLLDKDEAFIEVSNNDDDNKFADALFEIQKKYKLTTDFIKIPEEISILTLITLKYIAI